MKKTIIISTFLLAHGVSFSMEVPYEEEEVRALADIYNCKDAVSREIKEVKNEIAALTEMAAEDPELFEIYAQEIEKNKAKLADLFDDQRELTTTLMGGVSLTDQTSKPKPTNKQNKQISKNEQVAVLPEPKRTLKEKRISSLADTMENMHGLMKIDPDNKAQYRKLWQEAEHSLSGFDALEKSKEQFKEDPEFKEFKDLTEAIENKDLNENRYARIVRTIAKQSGTVEKLKSVIKAYQYEIAQQIVDSKAKNEDEEVEFLVGLLKRCVDSTDLPQEISDLLI